MARKILKRRKKQKKTCVDNQKSTLNSFSLIRVHKMLNARHEIDRETEARIFSIYSDHLVFKNVIFMTIELRLGKDVWVESTSLIEHQGDDCDDIEI
jgi:hypothetical protein